MDERKHHSGGAYRANSGGIPVGGSGGGGQRYVGGRNGGRGDHRRPKEREGRDQRPRNNRGRVSAMVRIPPQASDRVL